MIQIQHLLKLNLNKILLDKIKPLDSNTTLVKVKYKKRLSEIYGVPIQIQHLLKLNIYFLLVVKGLIVIQIQHLLKLNLIPKPV